MHRLKDKVVVFLREIALTPLLAGALASAIGLLRISRGPLRQRGGAALP
jgi:hypothetical protein